jgi:hypothetical protein
VAPGRPPPLAGNSRPRRCPTPEIVPPSGLEFESGVSGEPRGETRARDHPRYR